MNDFLLEPLGVVPVIVNAGSALLPAIIAPVVSFIALLFKPRLMYQACRRRPWVPLGVLLAIVLVWMVSTLTATKPPNPQTSKPQPSAFENIDWTEVARDLIRQERLGPATAPTTAPVTPTGVPLVYRRSTDRNGHDGAASPGRLDPKPLWAKQPVNVDSKITVHYLSSPLVTARRVYTAATFISAGATNGRVICLNLDGSRHWVFEKCDADPFPKGFFSSPALSADGKYLLIGQGLHDDEDSTLYCLEAETGEVHWRVETPLHLEGSPAIHGDMVIAGAGAIEGPNGKPISDPGFVMAVRISDGKKLWQHPVVDPESSPAISPDGAVVYIGSGFNGNAVVALRTDTDEQLKAKGLSREFWKTPVPYPATGAVTLAGDLVIIGCSNCNYAKEAEGAKPGGAVVALDASTGAIRWQRDYNVLAPIAHRGGVLIVPTFDGQVIALNAADGKDIWKYLAPGKERVLTGPAFTGEHVYVVTRDGFLIVLDAKNGDQLQRHGLNRTDRPGKDGLSVSSPTVAGGRVYVGSETGGLLCFIAGKGSADIGGVGFSPPPSGGLKPTLHPEPRTLTASGGNP